VSQNESEATERPWQPYNLTEFAIAQFKIERARQVGKEGWTPEHDDSHEDGELLRAGIAYFMHAKHGDRKDLTPFNWPWEPRWWKPGPPLRNLEKAGALAMAERDRHLRKNPRAYVGYCDQKIDQFAELYAELIVRAVNSYDRMREALEIIASWDSVIGKLKYGHQFETIDALISITECARAALSPKDSQP
jgi:hypothetical protein